MSFKKEVRQILTEIKLDVKELKTNVHELKTEQKIMNVELKEHTRRSTNLEERVSPLEHSHIFFNKLAKSIAAIMAVLAAAATIIHYFFK